MKVSSVVIAAIVLGSILSVLTGQSVTYYIQASQQQSITPSASSPFERLAQGQGQPEQTQGLQGQQSPQQTPKQQDMVLLSARLNDDGFGGQQIVGEVKNSGTEPAEFIQPFATFRDAQGAVVDTALTYAEKERIDSGDTSPFNLFIVSEVINQQAKTYDLSLEWQDLQGNQFTADVLTNQPFIPGAASARSTVSSTSGGGGGGNGDNDRDPCEDPLPGPNVTNPFCPRDNQTKPGPEPEPEPINCPEGQAANPSTGQCEPVSVPILPGNGEDGQEESGFEEEGEDGGGEDGGGEDGGGEDGGGEDGGGEDGGGEDNSE